MKKLDDVSLSTKLWVTYAVLLAAMAGVGLWLQYSANRAHEVAAQRTRAADDLITLATTWKTMSSANTAATLASLMSTEQPVTQFFGDRLKAGIAASSEMQKRIQELATTDADKKAFEDIATRRAVVLGLVKNNQELKNDVAPTIAQLLHISLGTIQGKPLAEILESPGRAASAPAVSAAGR